MKELEDKFKNIVRRWELAIDQNILLVIPVCVLGGFLVGLYL